MPRTSRNEVLFEALGKKWLASFSHKHSEKTGVVYEPPTGRPTLVKHLTTCRLSYADDPTKSIVGVSPCSLKDTYNWRKGIRRALQKALEKGRYCIFERIDNGSEIRELRQNPDVFLVKSLRDKLRLLEKTHRQERVVPLKDSYGEIMGAFFTELPKKDYWPHNQSKKRPAIIEGEIVPPENQQGLAYTGMD